MVIHKSQPRSRKSKGANSPRNTENRGSNSELDESDKASEPKMSGALKDVTDADFDDEDYSLTRWQSLLGRTTEMKSMATNCVPLSSHSVGDEVLAGLNEIIAFIKRIKNPTVPDFKQVDDKMQRINELVGQAIDSYLRERRGGSSSYKRMYQITKTVAACGILVGVISILNEWYPSWF